MQDNELLKLADALLQNINALRVEVRRNSGYLARREIAALLDELEPDRLEHFGYKVYSQHDEDGILAEIFRRLEVVNGTFCEIGVENGLECNTLNLLHNGWRGAWIEGNASQVDAIVEKFADLTQRGKLSLAVGFVVAENINSALSAALAPIGIDPGSLDLLSIDVDGMDVYLLEALETAPKVIVIEYNAKFPPPTKRKPVYDAGNVWKGTDYMGSSLSAIHESSLRKGYQLVATNINGTNAFLVRRDLVQDRFRFELTPENLYNPPRYWLYLDHFAWGIGHGADFGPYVDS